MRHLMPISSSHADTLLRITLFVLACLSLASCIDEDEYDDTPDGNFEALWTILDEHYCFFDYKNEQYGLDWDEVYTDYKKRISSSMTSSQLQEVLEDMLSELKDGHVNLSSSADFSRYWAWKEDYPSNVSDTLLRIYLGTDYKISAGMEYTVLDDNIGYIRYESFSDAIGNGNLDDVMAYLMTCNGLIIDIRGNGGGTLTYAERLASRFFNEDTTVGYMRHKTGKGHNDFSDYEEQEMETSSGVRWQKGVCVLTNREVYSAANEFVKYMKCAGATIVGDKTGGGAGLPFTSQLPNGWAVRFSACPMYDKDKVCTEHGIDPDYEVSLTDEDFAKGIDTIIEYARELLNAR